MKVCIVNTLPVPSGNASVNRFLGYCKGLVKQGADVTILSSASFDNSELDGIIIKSCGKNKPLPIALVNILREIRTQRYDVVILVSNSLFLIYPLWLACRINRVKLIQEKSEFPFVLMRKGFLNRLFAKFYVNTTYKLFDGLIVMTKPLLEFFKNKVSSTCRLFEMPMTVDVDRFDIEKEDTKYGEYIAYCGDLAGNKDGALNLIDAFNSVSPRIPNVSLLLIGGSSNKEDFDGIVKTVEDTRNEHIIMTGRINRDIIPSILKNAKALALARPSGIQSTGGFPTKLGEYLATGNPVIVTAVGDIPLYLNETNAFVVPPDDNSMFADAIFKVFTDYNHAMTVGKKGQELANTMFNAEVQSENLYNYLKEICE